MKITKNDILVFVLLQTSESTVQDDANVMTMRSLSMQFIDKCK